MEGLASKSRCGTRPLPLSLLPSSLEVTGTAMRSLPLFVAEP